METTPAVKPIGSIDRRKAESTLSQEPLELNSRHRVIMRQLLAGVTQGEIAKELGYTPSRISLIINSELFQVEMKKMREKIETLFIDNEGSKVQTDRVRQRIKEESLESVNTIVRLRDNAANERVRQISAFDILDRGGYKAPEKIDTTATVEVGDGLANALKEACKVIRSKDGKGE